MKTRARLIYNPTSGREEIKRRLPDILQRLDQGGLEVSAHATTKKVGATREAMEAAKAGFDLVIAAGGDGTLHEVVNGLVPMPAHQRPKLGVLPAGTTNDFARAARIPRNWDLACDVITRGRSRKMDIGRMNEQNFINIAGGGSMTELTYEVPSRLKTMIGQLAYYMKGVEKLPRFRPIELQIRSDVFSGQDQYMLFLVSNSNSVGGFEKLLPDARMDDGLLDVLLLRKCNLADLVKIVTLAVRGEHLNDPHIIHFQTDEITFQSEDHTQLNLDGEYGGTLPCHCSVLPSHLDILVDE